MAHPAAFPPMTLDSEDVEAIARRVAELLTPSEVGLTDARGLAEQLGVTREWVYANATRLGGVRLGTGPKARLRFDVKRAKEAVLGLTEEVQAPPQRQTRRRGRPPKANGLAPGAQLLRGRAG